jgi:hypothetical protein
MGSTFAARSFVSIAQPYLGLSDAMRDGPEPGLTQIDAVFEPPTVEMKITFDLPSKVH